MKHLLTFLKGLLFGASNLIPGMSGGTMLVITKIYNKLLEAISNLFKKFKSVIIFLLIFALGAVIGVLGGGIFIKKVLLEYAPFPTYCLFAGIILGSIPMLAKPVIAKINKKYIIAFIVGLVLVIGLMMVGILLPKREWSVEYLNEDTSFRIFIFVILFLAGFLGCFMMLIPGVSGVLMLVILDCYGMFMDALANVTNFHMNNYGNVIFVLAPVALGIIAGLFPASKLLNWLFKKFPVGSYFSILGFVIGSLGVIFVNFFYEYGGVEGIFSPLQIVLSVLALPLGFLVSFLLSKHKKNDEEIALENEVEDNNSLVEDSTKEEIVKEESMEEANQEEIEVNEELK